MKTSMIAITAGLALSALPSTANAQETRDNSEARRADTSFSVGEIVVTARGMAGSSNNVLTSVDRMGGDVAQNADVDNVYELIGQMPGIQVTDFNQGTTSGKFSMRGFNGEGNINAVKLLIDGIPSNSNDGNMPYIDMVFPLNIETIEVVRGTSDPRYGLHAIAGSANIITRSGGTYLDARGSVGSALSRSPVHDSHCTCHQETAYIALSHFRCFAETLFATAGVLPRHQANCASSASVFSPFTAASATFALKAGLWFRRGRLLISSPVIRPSWPPSGRKSTYPAAQIPQATSYLLSRIGSPMDEGR